jgi:hypothetical protein
MAQQCCMVEQAAYVWRCTHVHSHALCPSAECEPVRSLVATNHSIANPVMGANIAVEYACLEAQTAPVIT